MSTPNTLRYINIHDQYWICIDCQPLLNHTAVTIAVELENKIIEIRQLADRSWQTLPLDATIWQAIVSDITDSWKVTHTSRHFVEITNLADENSKITIHQQYRTATLTK